MAEQLSSQGVAPASPAPVRLGLVGVGSWGLNWVRAAQGTPGAELAWIADVSPTALAAAGRLAPAARATQATDALLAAPDVDAVVVATPTPTHHALAMAALQAGKHVLVEKPLCATAVDARRLADLAAAVGRVLVVGHLLLFHPAVERLLASARAGELGALRYLHAQRLNLGVVRRDESAWMSLAPHDVAIANQLFGGAPERVSCTGGAFLRAGVHDVVFGTLHYPGGRLAHVHASWLDPHKVRRLTVVGARQMAVFDDTSPDAKLTLFDRGVDPPASLSWAEGVAVRTGAITIPAVPVREPLAAQCEAFVAAVREGRAPAAVGPMAALDVVRVLEAGERSLARGGGPVELAELDR